MDYPFKRKPTERKREAKRAEKISSPDNNDKIGAKLGINRTGRNDVKIKFELNKIRYKPHLLKILDITEQDLKNYGF
jgi:hypothetical protein